MQKYACTDETMYIAQNVLLILQAQLQLPSLLLEQFEYSLSSVEQQNSRHSLRDTKEQARREGSLYYQMLYN